MPTISGYVPPSNRISDCGSMPAVCRCRLGADEQIFRLGADASWVLMPTGCRCRLGADEQIFWLGAYRHYLLNYISIRYNDLIATIIYQDNFSIRHNCYSSESCLSRPLPNEITVYRDPCLSRPLSINTTSIETTGILHCYRTCQYPRVERASPNLCFTNNNIAFTYGLRPPPSS
jgi:hypothetical protein